MGKQANLNQVYNTKENKSITQNKKTTKKKNKKKQSVYIKRGAQQTEKEDYKDDIILGVTFMISVLLVLSNFHLTGKLGNSIYLGLFGIFGIIAYLLPFLFLFAIAFGIANRGNKKARRKVVSSILLYLVFTPFSQLLSGTYKANMTLLQYYKISVETKSGGGIVGGLLCQFFCPLFGVIGTLVILVVFALILIMFLTERAIFSYFHNTSVKKLKQLQRNYRQSKRKNIKQTNIRIEDTMKEQTKRSNPVFYTFPKSNNPAKMQEVKPSPSFDISFFKQHEHHLGKDANLQVNDTSKDKKIRMKVDKEKQLDMDLSEEKEDNPTMELEENQLESNKKEKEAKTKIAEEIYKQELKRKFQEESKLSNPFEYKSIIQAEEEIAAQREPYQVPPSNLLNLFKKEDYIISGKELKETAIKLQQTLENFGVSVTITNVSCGPSVTRYELQPEQGVKVSKITNLADDIKLNLAATDIRIEAPIPGKAAIGIEVPNKANTMVFFRSLIESREFQNHDSPLAFAVGKDISGQTIVTDIAKMPHLLIAGATGSGKSVCINTIIMSILYKSRPEDVKLIMIDPKIVELNAYNGIPHLLLPVVTDPKQASAALNWAVTEMIERYNKFAQLGVRDISGYNKKIEFCSSAEKRAQTMPKIVIIVDELADLMMVAPGAVEDAICRLAQMARAAGLHLILATQRPSVNVITGVIKANIPSRIAFSVSSAVDSRTILDGSGAEKLLGRGDMLFFPSGYPKPIRLQGAFISDKEVSKVVCYVKEQNNEYEIKKENEAMKTQILNSISEDPLKEKEENKIDTYFIEAGKLVIEKDKASIGMLQRAFKIGFNRAARIIEQLSIAGVVGEEEGTKPRKVIMPLEEFEQYIEDNR